MLCLIIPSNTRCSLTIKSRAAGIEVQTYTSNILDFIQQDILNGLTQHATSSSHCQEYRRTLVSEVFHQWIKACKLAYEKYLG